MTNDAIKEIIASIRHHLGILSEEKGDVARVVRQAVIASVLAQLDEIESRLK